MPIHSPRDRSRARQQILIDIARRIQRLKHGASQAGNELHESRIAMSMPSEELLAVNDALAALVGARSPKAAEVVQAAALKKCPRLAKCSLPSPGVVPPQPWGLLAVRG